MLVVVTNWLSLFRNTPRWWQKNGYRAPNLSYAEEVTIIYVISRLVGFEMGLMLIFLFINNPEAQVK